MWNLVHYSGKFIRSGLKRPESLFPLLLQFAVMFIPRDTVARLYGFSQFS